MVNLQIISSCEFDLEKDSQDLTFVLFGDNWCSLCTDVKYIMEEIKALHIPVYLVDISKNTYIMEKYSIEEIPTVIVFKKGRIVGFIVGKQPKNRYLDFI